MALAPQRLPPSGRKFAAALHIAYVELQYWVIGLTPEPYHWQQATACETLEKYPRAVHHFGRCLTSKESAWARGLLAYCHAQLGDWSDEAYAAIGAMEARYADLGAGLRQAIARLKDEMKVSGNSEDADSC